MDNKPARHQESEAEAKERRRLEKSLEEGLEDSFPASDPDQRDPAAAEHSGQEREEKSLIDERPRTPNITAGPRSRRFSMFNETRSLRGDSGSLF